MRQNVQNSGSDNCAKVPGSPQLPWTSSNNKVWQASRIDSGMRVAHSLLLFLSQLNGYSA